MMTHQRRTPPSWRTVVALLVVILVVTAGLVMGVLWVLAMVRDSIMELIPMPPSAPDP
ncbi:hypothetical protein [Nonomuraea africana]|uniref:Uncharacterized protein n=1 Tax=Nonomuraea africana TaxID=46171 RepID=A0ABR9KT66_9ACTN|nr:hypothetical protein [Nonomuraea africana]MBE1564793.1 hypothetical protein [Nonomuraea africana]